MTSINFTTYKDIKHWRQYLPFLPSWLRFSDENYPIEEWWSWRGADIHLDRYPVKHAPLSVILLHGAGGYGRLLAPFAQMLQRQGYEVIALDLPGYGLSRSPGKLINHDRWVECVVDLVQDERTRKKHPVTLFGCSLGGYLAFAAAAKSKNVAGVIATTLADPRLPVVQRQFARHPLLGMLAPHTLPLLDSLFGSVRVPIRWVSNMAAIANDSRLVEIFLTDRCGGGNTVPVHFMRSLFEATPDVEPDQFDLCPVLLAHPAADRWTTLEASQPLFDRIKVYKRLVMLDNCGHFPVEEPGVSQLREAVTEFLEGLCQASA
jgi:alpha-beta hydrolase superfamily lysophospholipase